MRMVLRTTVFLAAALSAATAAADCIEGMRNATPGETQYFNSVYSALKDALPPAPAGWTLAKATESKNVGSFCKGDREGDFDIVVTGNYTYRRPKEESDRLYAESRKVQAEIDALNQLPPDIAKERQGWLDKMSEANRASNRAAKEGNKALARQLSDEADGYSKKGREVRERHLVAIQPQIAQLEAKQKALNYGDISVSLRLVANERDAKKSNLQTMSELMFGKSPAPKSTGLKVQGIRVVVEGQSPKRDEILNAVDREKLTRMVK